MKKIFENIAALEFDEKKQIVAMQSSDGEKIQLVDKLNPTSKNVEYWMGDVEKMMFSSIRHEMLEAIKHYEQQDRVEWILSHPGQCVLNGS